MEIAKTLGAAWIASAATALLAGGVASAQITVPITGFHLGNSVPASPTAAYSNMTDYLGTFGGPGSLGLSTTTFSNLTASPALQGQTVQSLRLGITLRLELTNPAPTRRCRVQVGFWNADGPNGLAGTPVQGLAGFAQYQTAVLEMTRGTSAVITLDLGSSGFVVPTGQFFFGMAFDTRGLDGFSPGDFTNHLYGAPAVGTNQPGLYRAAYENSADPLAGIPWGAIFGSSAGPTMYPLLPPSSASLGIELILPAPASGSVLAVSGLVALRRRRS